MGQNLANKQLGGADGTFRWILHTSGESLATGARISNGEGEDAGMTVYEDGIGINKGTQPTLRLSYEAVQTFLKTQRKSIDQQLNVGSGAALVIDDLGFQVAPSRRYVVEYNLVLRSTVPAINLSLIGLPDSQSVFGTVIYSSGGLSGVSSMAAAFTANRSIPMSAGANSLLTIKAVLNTASAGLVRARIGSGGGNATLNLQRGSNVTITEL